MLFISLDPGTATGWATYEDGILSLDVISSKFESVARVEGIVSERTDVQLVLESFIPRQGVTFIPGSLHIIGSVSYLAWKYGLPDVILQSPGDAKGPFPDAVLKRWGAPWWHRSDHARDAARHMAVALVKRRLVNPRTGLPQAPRLAP